MVTCDPSRSGSPSRVELWGDRLRIDLSRRDVEGSKGAITARGPGREGRDGGRTSGRGSRIDTEAGPKGRGG